MTHLTPLEALADAISAFEGNNKPGSRPNRNRNPGNLRPYPGYTGPTDGENYRVFDSHVKGYQALLDDLTAKLHGSHGLTPQSTIFDLLNIYAPAGDHNNPTNYAKFVVWWLTIALGKSITLTTTLGDYTK